MCFYVHLYFFSQSISMKENKVVSTLTLQATAEVMKNGVTCEVTNEHGTDSKTFPVSLKRGQCHFLSHHPLVRPYRKNKNIVTRGALHSVTWNQVIGRSAKVIFFPSRFSQV